MHSLFIYLFLRVSLLADFYLAQTNKIGENMLHKMIFCAI